MVVVIFILGEVAAAGAARPSVSVARNAALKANLVFMFTPCFMRYHKPPYRYGVPTKI
jgi:hypothetical protein